MNSKIPLLMVLTANLATAAADPKGPSVFRPLIRRMRALRRAVLGLLACLAVGEAAAAQPAESGVVTGHVSIPATGEFVRDAQIRVAGKELAAVSEGGGYYRLSGVAPGRVTLVVAYTGFTAPAAEVQVTAGPETVQDFALVSTLEQGAAGRPILLQAFQVDGAREGNAKAIMQQRAAMDITTSVATDAFGQAGDQNVAEFLKNLAGVDTTRVAGGIRNVQLRGLPAEYTAVNVDGLSPAVADANTGAAGNARAISFEQLSLSSIESVEILKTVSADQDASAPAGTINLRMKRAFDRQGRRIAWELNTTAFSENFSLRRTLEPDEERRRRVFPGGSLSYSDVLFDRRLGLALNLTQANTFSAITRGNIAYNFTPTATDRRPAVVNTISLLHGQRLFQRTGASLTADFKATSSLVLSLGIIYNFLDQWSPQATVGFATGSRAAVSGADPLVDFTVAGATSNVNVNYQGISKLGRTTSYAPRFEYKRGDLRIEGKLGYSDATSFYTPLRDHSSVPSFGSPASAGVSYRVSRSSLTRADFQVTQLAGPDWSSGARFTAPSVTVDDGRYQRSRRYNGQLDATFKTTAGLPIEWKAGIKANRIAIRFDLTTNWNIYNYTGPGSGVGAWAQYPSPYSVDLGPIGASVRSLSGGPVFLPHLTGVGSLFRRNPEYFTQVATAANFNTAFVVNHKDFTEDVNAGYLMGTTRVGRLQIRAGLRREDNFLDSVEFDPQPPSAVVAAGFAVTAAGLATTVPGVQYQYFSKPKVSRRSDYHNYFPSAAAKYKFGDHLEAQVGYSETIRRPTFRDISGVTIINEQTQTLTLPNPRLRPEDSKNLSARLAYYFEPVGMLAANVFQNRVTGLHFSTRMTAQEYGYTGEEFANYSFVSAVQSLDETLVRGMELEYRQSLSFLPGVLKGLTVHANYSRTYAEVIYPSLAPHRIAGGLSYSFGRVGVYTNMNWSADTPRSTDGNNYTRHRLDADLGGAYRLSSRASFFFTAKNILNTPQVQMTNRLAGPAMATMEEVWGTEWVFGFKGSF